MPNYEYRCNDCKTHFEISAPAKAKPQHPVCSHCQGTNTQAVFSVFAIGSCSKNSSLSKGGSCSTCSGGSCSNCH